jgi:predicted PurR-regulated permease PerM
MKALLRSAWVRLLVTVAAAFLLGWLAFLLRDVLTPFAVAFALAYFLNPLANVLERFFAGDIARSKLFQRWLEPRTVAVAILMILLLAVLVLIVLVVVPTIYHQLADTIAKVPDYARRLRERIEPLLQRLNVAYPEQYEEVRQRIQEALRENLPQIVTPVTGWVRTAFTSVLGFVLTLLNLLVIPVFAAYLLYDMNKIREGARELVPVRHRAYVYSRFAKVDQLLSAFARGQVTVALILGSFYAIGLTATGVPMGLVVGFVIGFFNLIPFMSYVAGLPLALLLSWLDDQSLGKLVAVAIIFTFGQFVEGNFITPRIVGQSLGLHAVVIMLAVLVFGTLFGFIGMLVAVPVTATLSVFWADLRDLYLQSEFYREEPQSALRPHEER